MKLIILQVIVILLIGCGVGFVVDFREQNIDFEENMIVNSGFEKGNYYNDNLPENWFVLEKTNGRIFWDNEIALNGKKSLRIQNPDQKISILSDAFSINSQAVYLCKAYIKNANVSTNPVIISFYAFDKNGKKVNKFSQKVYTHKKWTELKLTSGFLKSGAKYGRVKITIPHERKNTFWLDDVGCFYIHSFTKRK